MLKKNSFAIIDTDIPQYSLLKKICNRRKIKILSFGSKGNTIKLISHYFLERQQIIKINFLNKIYNVSVNLIGDFQIKNLFAAIIAVYLSFKDKDKIINTLTKINTATGRMQYVGNKKKSTVVVDYAHTPDALKKSLQTLAKQFNKKVDVVFGCGGDRDQGKRFKMGKIADQFASKIYLTNDNPRYENPISIIRQIKKGCPRSKVILDRKIAIKLAIKNLKMDSILLIAGKGHENYQIINNKKLIMISNLCLLNKILHLTLMVIQKRLILFLANALQCFTRGIKRQSIATYGRNQAGNRQRQERILILQKYKTFH